ncbi:MAG: hypothetical protein ACRC8S_13770 [Fimbriiglobus sp.]
MRLISPFGLDSISTMTPTPLPSLNPWQCELQQELRRLLALVLGSVAKLSTTTPPSPNVAFAPIEACVKLADLWTIGLELGYPIEELRADFTSEEQFILELITSIYSAGQPRPYEANPIDIQNLWQMLEVAEEG